MARPREILIKLEEKGDSLKKLGVRKVGLFGSYLYGRQNKRSDVDLLVRLSKKGKKNYFDLWIYLERVLKKKVDLVLEDNLLPRISYVRKEAKYARL